jgi:hypothetical protein
MNNTLLKKVIPHLIALVVFMVVAMAFCWPAMEGNVLDQHDTVGWKGMAQNSFEYFAKNGKWPMWNPNLFGGMPNYQVALGGKSILPDTVSILSLGLPKPVNFFFLACVFFYLLCIVLRVKPVLGMLAAIAYSLSTYNPVIVAAGHDTQMLATAFVPLVLAGLISLYEKKYWLGFALTTFGAYQQIAVNHLQVTYYLFIIAVLMSIGYLIKWIKEKDWKHIGIASGIAALSAIIALAGNALVLKTTSEYSKFTMRGGKEVEIEGDNVKKVKTSGLDTSYAFEYSLGKAETFTLLMPNAFGGGSSKTLNENSAVVSKLVNRGVDEANAIQMATSLPKYWGALPYTSGPAYLGVTIFLFGILGFVLIQSPLRWGLLAATLLGIMMGWGKNFAGFNVFLFENLPLYNKFRAPSFAQVIPQVAMGIMAVLALQQLLFVEKSKAFIQQNIKPILYTIAGLLGVLTLLYFGLSYHSPIDAQIIAGYIDKNGSDEMGRLIVSGLKADRKAMFGGQLLRAIGFALFAVGIIWLYLKNMIKPIVAAIVLLIVSSVEIFGVSKAYLPTEAYVSTDDYEGKNFEASTIDKQIKQDTAAHYRVFNMAGSSNGSTFSESRTSYFHKSVGGYHPAKLRIYQDIIEKYLSGAPNPQVLNMLNTKYVIVPDQQTGQPALIVNPDAYGACWLVKNVRVVEDRVASLKAIGTTQLKDTAIIEKGAADAIVQPQQDSTAYIKLVKFDNDNMEYESNSNSNQFAVFSEVYYPKGWNAYIDDKKVNYVNVNYVLRGLSVPAGKHTIHFKFEPDSVKSGKSIMYIASIVILISLLGGLFMAWKSAKKQ